MAERLFRKAAVGRHEVRSAGSDPGDAPHLVVVEALAEIGIDATDHVPQRLDDEVLAWADLAISTCSEEVCPVTFGVERLSWPLPDPKNLGIEEVRDIRDDIERRVRDLTRDLDADDAPA